MKPEEAPKADVAERQMKTLTPYEAVKFFINSPDQINYFISKNIPAGDVVRWHEAFKQFAPLRAMVGQRFAKTAEECPEIVTRTMLFTYLAFCGDDNPKGFSYATKNYLEPLTMLMLEFFTGLNCADFDSDEEFTLETLYYFFSMLAADYRFYQSGEVEHQALFEGLIDTHLKGEDVKRTLKSHYDPDDICRTPDETLH